MSTKKTKPSITDWKFRIPGYILLLGFWVEYDLAKSGLASPDIVIGEKTIPLFGSLGYLGLGISLLPYIIMGWNAFWEWKNSGNQQIKRIK